jgi:hypothetical protein
MATRLQPPDAVVAARGWAAIAELFRESGQRSGLGCEPQTGCSEKSVHRAGLRSSLRMLNRGAADASEPLRMSIRVSRTSLMVSLAVAALGTWLALGFRTCLPAQHLRHSRRHPPGLDALRHVSGCDTNSPCLILEVMR